MDALDLLEPLEPLELLELLKIFGILLYLFLNLDFNRKYIRIFLIYLSSKNPLQIYFNLIFFDLPDLLVAPFHSLIFA